MNTDKNFEAVAAELRSGVIREGLWAKALAEGDGDEARARAVYIRLRAAQIEEARRQEERLEDERRRSAEVERGRAAKESIAREEAERVENFVRHQKVARPAPSWPVNLVLAIAVAAAVIWFLYGYFFG